MKFLKISAIFSLGLVLSACGGGGGGGTTTPPKVDSSVNSSASSISSKSSSSVPATEFSLSPSEINLQSTITELLPFSNNISASLKNSDSPVYFVINEAMIPFMTNSLVSVDSTNSTISLTPNIPSARYPGKHSGKLSVRACKDALCAQEYPGSPKFVTVNYEVTAPTYALSKKQLTFNMVDGQGSLTIETIGLTSSENFSQIGLLSYAPYPGWLTLPSFSVNGSNATLDLGVSQYLAPGTYTANLGLYVGQTSLTRRLDVTVNVTSGSSSSSSSSSAAGCAGVVFTETVCSEWQPASIFEQNRINLPDYSVIKNSPSGKLITLLTKDSGDSLHNQVLDVVYNSNTEYTGEINIDTKSSSPGVDMSEYANGKIIFDVKVISKGDANKNLNMRVECGWPCQSNVHEINVPTLNTWTTFEIPVADLVADGLNLEQLTTVLQIFPEWGLQSNAHFQVDNIRWVK